MTGYALGWRVSTTTPMEPDQRIPGHPSVGDSPLRADYPNDDDGDRAYQLAWRIWRAQHCDCQLTAAEAGVRWQTQWQFLLLLGASLPHPRM